MCNAVPCFSFSFFFFFFIHCCRCRCLNTQHICWTTNLERIQSNALFCSVPVYNIIIIFFFASLVFSPRCLIFWVRSSLECVFFSVLFDFYFFNFFPFFFFLYLLKLSKRSEKNSNWEKKKMRKKTEGWTTHRLDSECVFFFRVSCCWFGCFFSPKTRFQFYHIL